MRSTPVLPFFSSLAVFLASPILAQPATPPRQATPDPFDDAVFTQQLPPLDPVPAEPAPPPVAPPTLPDPELAAPLPPLATADTTPPQVVADVSNDADAPQIRYRVELSGFREAGVDDQFRSLSALLHDRKRTANSIKVTARANEDVKLAERLLRSEGYYDGTVTSAIGPLPDAQGVLLVALTASPGTLYKLGSVTVTGAAPEPTGIALDSLQLKSGDPIVATTIETGEARVALHLPEQGYPFASVGQRDILLDDQTHLGEYTLPVAAGPKARFGGFRVAGDPVFDTRHIALFPRFKAGELYDSRQIDDLRQALVATSLFSTVAIEPVRTERVNPDGTEQVDLLVRQVKGPWRSLAGSAGYGTGEGLKLTGSYTNRNLLPPEGAVTVAAVAGTQEQSLSGLFARSNAGQRDRTLSAGLSVARQRFEAYNAETIQLNASLARASTPIWQKRWTWSLGSEVIATRETHFNAARAVTERDIYFIAALPLQLGYDRSNSLLDPTHGFRLAARASPEVQKQRGGGFDRYARLLFDGSAYYPVTDNLVIAGRGRVGSILGVVRDDIAPSRRLYAGGGGSVRGFGYQELGPRDLENKPLGGRSLTEFALEARYRFGDYGVVPFFDAGRVGEGTTPSLSGMRYGVGIGARYYTNFGPLRIDVATPLARRPGESRIALYISIGQAF